MNFYQSHNDVDFYTSKLPNIIHREFSFKIVKYSEYEE